MTAVAVKWRCADVREASELRVFARHPDQIKRDAAFCFSNDSMTQTSRQRVRAALGSVQDPTEIPRGPARRKAIPTWVWFEATQTRPVFGGYPFQ